MAIARDPLGVVEAAYVLDQSTRKMRRDVRNKLASIRNLAFYLRRGAQKTEVWNDPKVPLFFGHIDNEIVTGDSVIEAFGEAARWLYTRDVAWTQVQSCVDLAAGLVRTPVDVVGVDVSIDLEPAELCIEAREIAVAIRCLIENAL